MKSALHVAGPEVDLPIDAFRPEPTGHMRLHGKGGGGGGGNTTTVQKADPWTGVQPYLQSLYQAGADWAGSGALQFYPGQTVANQAPETLRAQQETIQRALMGSPLTRGAQNVGLQTLAGGFLGRPSAQLAANPWMQSATNLGLATMGGGFLGANPYLNSMFMAASNPLVSQFSRAIAPSITSQFAAGGRYGSGAHQAALSDASGQLGQSLASLGAQIYGPAYEAERQRQQQSMAQSIAVSGLFQQGEEAERARQQAMLGMAPQLGELDYADLSRLAAVGQAREARAQELINAEIARWDANQQAPLTRLNALNALLQGGMNFGTTSSRVSTPGGGFNLSGALGGGMLGSSVLPWLGSIGALGSTAAASTMMSGAGLNALGGLGLGPLGFLGGALLGGLF